MPFWVAVRMFRQKLRYKWERRPWWAAQAPKAVKCPVCGCKSNKLFKPHEKHKHTYYCEACGKMLFIAVVGEKMRGKWDG